MTADLAGFLLARIAEDEAAVNDRTRHLAPGGWSYLEQFGDFGDDERWMIEIPAARVLAECEAKRRIVGLAGWTGRRDSLRDRLFGPAADEAFQQGIKAALRLLALPYADHPDYDEEWRP